MGRRALRRNPNTNHHHANSLLQWKQVAGNSCHVNYMGHRAGSHPPLHSAEGFGDCTGFYHTVDHSFEGLVSLFTLLLPLNELEIMQ